MKKYIAAVIFLLLIATGCGTNSGNTTQGPQMSGAAKGTPTQTSPKATSTQASSISTLEVKKDHSEQRSLSAQQTGGTVSLEKQVLGLVNSHRSQAGLTPLEMDDPLSQMAMFKAKDMVHNSYFSHQSPTYGSPFDMMRSFGISYRFAGENIAQGQPTAEQVMNDWMNSPGHRANIMSGNFTRIGLAYYNGAWVQEFTG